MLSKLQGYAEAPAIVQNCAFMLAQCVMEERRSSYICYRADIHVPFTLFELQ
jgi:hypothetical protein